jgi:hypothetical protein
MATTITGVRVFDGEHMTSHRRAEAENILRRDGLSCLGDPWWVEDEPGHWKEARIQEARPDRLRIRWADPLADQPAHGHRVDPRVVRVQRHRPE